MTDFITGQQKVKTTPGSALGAVTDEATWTKIAFRHITDARLDEQSIGLIRRQMQNLWAADRSGLAPDVKLTNLLQRFQLSIALDTVRNEYMLHPKIHALLAVDLGRSGVEVFNERVYAELFLTPASDPWLGLFSPETYMALEGGGVTPSK